MNETSDPSQALARRWFQKAENDLLKLDRYSVSIRYPQEYEEEPDEEEVREAVEAAYVVRAWVRSQLGLE
jgi:hypothetical protein